MGHAIAVANMKGGVGKTTTTVSLGDSLAAAGKAVMIVDLDAQANASVCVVGTRSFESLVRQGKTVGSYFEKNIHAANFGEPSRSISDFWSRGLSTVSHRGKALNVTLLAATPDIRYLEREIIIDFNERGFGLRALETKLSQILGNDLAKMRQVYDFILFDCAPGISPFSEAAIRLADLVIAPTIPDFISVQGLPLFCNYLAGQQQRSTESKTRRRRSPAASAPSPTTAGARRRIKPYVLPTRVRLNTIQHREYLDRIKDAARNGGPYHVFGTSIPDSIKVSEAIAMVETTSTYQQRWEAIVDELESLTHEIGGVLSGNAL